MVDNIYSEYAIGIGCYAFFQFQSIPCIQVAKTETLISSTLSNFNSKGTSFTSEGPDEYVGNILEHPDLLWTEDLWDEFRVQDAKRRIENQGAPVALFWRKKYEDRANSYWNNFYKRNKSNFYKDRHYLHVVFPELAPEFHSVTELKLLEVGRYFSFLFLLFCLN